MMAIPEPTKIMYNLENPIRLSTTIGTRKYSEIYATSIFSELFESNLSTPKKSSCTDYTMSTRDTSSAESTPRRVESIDEKNTCVAQNVTTLMVRGIYKRNTQERVIKELEREGFTVPGAIDFFYLPHSVRVGLNYGYMVINFTSPAIADKFMIYCNNPDGYLRKMAKKNFYAVPGTCQGCADNMMHYITCTADVKNGAEKPTRPIISMNN